jgi:hypothetical protein
MCLRLSGRGSGARLRPPQKQSQLPFCRLADTAGRLGQLLSRSRCALLLVVALATALVIGTSTSSRADVEPKRILMLHSFGLRFKPWTDYAEEIRTEIGRRKSVDFHDHSLLGARVEDPKSEGPFVAYLSALNAD